jgi:shikimate kinase
MPRPANTRVPSTTAGATVPNAVRQIFITGVSCVGKTTIGARLATLLDRRFVNLDTEIETFFATSIERLQRRFLTSYSYRQEASKALRHALAKLNSQAAIIDLPPSGLMDSFWRVVKTISATIIVLEDEPENILARVTFYDIDSRPISKRLTASEKRYYLRDIKEDMGYFRRTYRRADLRVNIAGLAPDAAALKIKAVLDESAFTAPASPGEKYVGPAPS